MTERARIQRLLVVCNGADAEGLSVMNNLCAAFEFARLDWSVLDLEKAPAWPDLDEFSCVVTCTDHLDDIDERSAGRLRDYVHTGGGLMVALRCGSMALADLFGFQTAFGMPAFTTSLGLVFEQDIVPGAAGLTIAADDWVFEHDRLAIARDDLSADSTVLISDSEGAPVAWRRPEGSGRVVFWNTAVLSSRALRGFGVQSALDSMEIGVSAMAGFGMLHVDDFPPSISAARQKPIANEFPDLDWTGFAFDVWQHDMRALSIRHDVPLTWYLVMNYFDVDNGAVADPANPIVADGHRVLRERFGKVVPGEGDEYGFHGYNHDPLIDSIWHNRAALKSKLQYARSMWESAVPAPLPTSWVPANNWYHNDHVRILAEVFPEITTVCGLHSTSETDLGGLRDFGPEPWVPALLCLPRETSGYLQTPAQRLLMLSQIAGLGLWTHFIHPDDVVDIPGEPGSEAYSRNPDLLMWRAKNVAGQPGLLSHLDAWLGEVRERFPWMQFLTTSGAVEAWRRHIRGKHAVDVFENRIEISSDRGRTICVSVSDNVKLGRVDSARRVGAFDYRFKSLIFLKLESNRATLHFERKHRAPNAFGMASGFPA